MPRHATPLSAQKVAKAKSGRYYDGDGLILLVRSAPKRDSVPRTEQDQDRAWWVYRYTLRGRTRELGIGRARGRNSVSLSDARTRAAEYRQKVKAGIDPLAEREAEEARKKAEAAKAAAAAKTFRQVAEMYVAAHEAGWRNAKHRQQWVNTLTEYAYPHLGDLPVAEIETGHVTAALEPIWRGKTETASRVRIESVLDYAKARKWRDGENPARWRGHLDHLLPPKGRVARVEHHAALPWREMGAFMVDLRGRSGIGARALEFAILTAARSGEVRGARWDEIAPDRPGGAAAAPSLAAQSARHQTAAHDVRALPSCDRRR